MAVQGTVVSKPWVAPVLCLGLAGLGVFLAKICIFDVLEAARRHEPSVSLSMKGVIMAPAIIVLGLAGAGASIFGIGTNPVNAPGAQTRRMSPKAWAATIALLAIGFGIYFWMRSTLADYGYDF